MKNLLKYLTGSFFAVALLISCGNNTTSSFAQTDSGIIGKWDFSPLIANQGLDYSLTFNSDKTFLVEGITDFFPCTSGTYSVVESKIIMMCSDNTYKAVDIGFKDNQLYVFETYKIIFVGDKI